MSPALRYIGIDAQLAQALRGIQPGLQLDIQIRDEEEMRQLCLTDISDADLDAFRDGLATTIVYGGRFEFGVDGSSRIPLSELRSIVQSREGVSGIVVLNAFIVPPSGVGGRQGRWISGTVSPAVSPPGQEHWTNLFWPDGYDRPQSEVRSDRRMISKIDRLAYDCIEYLGLAVPSHVYELHLTVHTNSASEYESFKDLCAAIGIKCIQINFPEEEDERHTITGSFHRGSLEKVYDEARRLADDLTKSGFPVNRIKLETTMGNPAVPTTPAEAQRMSDDQYFECHAKVVLPASGADDRLRAICEEQSAHISQNASNRLADGSIGVFITQRFFRTTKGEALAEFSRLLATLRSSGYEISNVLREFAIVDTNILLDEKWIPHVAHA